MQQSVDGSIVRDMGLPRVDVRAKFHGNQIHDLWPRQEFKAMASVAPQFGLVLFKEITHPKPKWS